MIKFYDIMYYYCLTIIGSIMTSWIIWSRFIRERSIREIPDYLQNIDFGYYCIYVFN